MTDTISLEAVQGMLAEETGDVFLALIKITHDDLTADVLLVNNNVDIDFDEGFGDGTQTWQGLAFEITLPPDVEDQMPTVQLKIDNVHRTVVEAVRSISSPPEVELSIIRVNSSGVINREMGPMPFRLNMVDYDALEVTGTLGYRADYLNEKAVQHNMDPTIFPGLFA